MIHRTSQVLCVWFLFWDLILTAAAWLGAYYLRFESGWIPIYKEPPVFETCWRQLPLVALLSAIAYRLTGQYTIHRLRRFREEMVGVLKGTALLSLLVLATIYYLQNPYESRATMLLFSLLTATGILLARRLSWYALSSSRPANAIFSARVGSALASTTPASTPRPDSAPITAASFRATFP